MTGEPVRIDRWLWAARFVKTRGLAVEAVKGGRVKIDGEPVKPSKDVRPGQRLEFSSGELRRTVIVLGTAERRGPASEAQALYRETDESRAARERVLEQRQLAPPPLPGGGGRPTKRDRRRLDAARGTRRDPP